MLHTKLPADAKININILKILFAIPVVYIIGLLFWVMDPSSSGSQPNSVTFIIVPLHLISMVCIFLSFRYAAKIMKSVELGRMAKVSDYIGEFMLIWFMPLGVWILQPRLNKLVQS